MKKHQKYHFWNIVLFTRFNLFIGYLDKLDREGTGQGVREKARVFETLNFFGKGLTQIETDVQLL